MRNVKSLLFLTGAFGVAALLGIYIYRQSAAFLKGPVITLEQTAAGPFADSFYTLSGHAANVAFLSMNGNQIYTDEKGDFKEKLLLIPGYNIIQIKARDKFGREHAEIVELVHTPVSSTTTIH